MQLPRDSRSGLLLLLLSVVAALSGSKLGGGSAALTEAAPAAEPAGAVQTAPWLQSSLLAPAPSPVPGIAPAIFPVIPGSFRTAASNAAVDWNIVSPSLLLLSKLPCVECKLGHLVS